MHRNNTIVKVNRHNTPFSVKVKRTIPLTLMILGVIAFAYPQFSKRDMNVEDWSVASGASLLLSAFVVFKK